MAAPAASAGFADGLPQGVPGLDTTLGMSRMMNKKPLYVAMLRRYLAGQKEVVKEIRQALAAGDTATAERIAHTTKSVSGNVGATQVQQRAEALESALRAHADAQQVEGLILELATPLSALLAALGEALAHEGQKT